MIVISTISRINAAVIIRILSSLFYYTIFSQATIHLFRIVISRDGFGILKTPESIKFFFHVHSNKIVFIKHLKKSPIHINYLQIYR